MDTARFLGPLGQRVRALRTARGLTARELAARSGLSPRFVAELEAGRGNISVMRLASVAEALATSASSLLQGLSATPVPDQPLVALLGLRGAGKSTIGPLLAKRLALPFQELDVLVEREAGLSRGEIFEVHGESYYRRLERDVVEELVERHQASGHGLVLAAGGGLVNEPRTWRLLRARAATVWLRARPEDHWSRVVAQGDRRPMARNPHAMADLRALLAERSPRYAEAGIIVDTSARGIEGSVEAIAAALAPA